MTRRSQALALVAAFIVPALLLAWIGLGSLREESKRAAERYRAQAEAIAQAAADELVRAGRELQSARGPLDPLAVRFAADGKPLGLPARHPPPQSAGDPELALVLADEIDRLQAQGRLEDAILRLAEIAELSARNEDAELCAWALDSRAALLDVAGRAADAQAVRRDLVARFPAQRNRGGLVRSFAARRSLLDVETDPIRAALALYGDASIDQLASNEAATAEFLRQLRLELGQRCSPAQAAALASADRDDAARALLRVWRATLAHGPTDWVAQGAPGGSAVFEAALPSIPSANPLSIEFPRDPGRAGSSAFLVSVQRDGEEWSGGAVLLASVFERALDVAAGDAAVRELGFVASIEPRAELGTPAAFRLELPQPLAAYSIAVRGGDLAGFAARERVRFLSIAGLVASAIATAAVGAWFALRGVAREIEAARGREEFVAAVTHELKAPLAAIRLFGEMQERGDLDPAKAREFGARTVAESDRLAHLVDSVLDLARIEHGASVHPAQLVELDAVARAAIAIVGGVAREHGSEIALLEGSSGRRVRGDGEALTRALVNLLDNALKYGDGPQRVEIEIAARDGICEVSVLDRGRGVPEAERTRIFEAFRRVGSELTRDRPGAGLGLALVAKIAAAHGGRATCSPREGGGSRFTLSLPEAPGGSA